MDNRANAYLRRQQARFMRPDAARWVRPDAAKFLKPGTRVADVYPALAQQRDARQRKHDCEIAEAIAHEQAVLAALRAELDAVKALLARRRSEQKYNEDQPRVPAGNTGGGQWTSGGSGRPRVYITTNPEDEVGDGGSGFSLPMGSIDFGDIGSEIDKLDLFDIKPQKPRSGGVRLAGDVPDRLPEIVVTPGDGGASGEPGIGHNGGPPLEDPPEIPRTRPGRSRQRTAVQRVIGSWIGRALNAIVSFVGRAIARRARTLLKVFSAVVNSIPWLQQYWAQIETYRDPPKTLKELQGAVGTPRAGTEVHHRAEKEAMKLSGYSDAEIDAPDNLVRIPTLKHYEITGWYQQPNKEFGGKTPREYLADKPLDERLQVGNKALILFGIMKP